MRPFFSIITVTRNNLEGLTRTKNSLDTQLCRDFEWIVIDGASQDGTEAFLQNTSANWVSEPDQGIYDAMNKGIARAAGEYLLFLNAGDCLPFPTTLSTLRPEIPPMADFIYGDALESFPDGPRHFKKARSPRRWAYGMITHHQAMLYRRAALGDIRYNTAYPIAADYDFTLRFLQKNPAIFYAAGALCLFESGGLSQQRAAQGRREQCQIRKTLGIVSPFKNHVICMLQSFALVFRQIFPKLYWRLRV